MQTHESIVIGAGISGLLCAQALHDSGVDVLVLEKGRGVGGRMATRRFAGGRADHGAQLFTSRDLRFQMIVDEWLGEKVCKRWYVSKGCELGAQGYVRYCGRSGMTDAPKWIARNLQVHKETLVDSVHYDASSHSWRITVQGELAFECQTLFLTAPLPQSLTLLEAGDSPLELSLHDELKGIRYHRGITVIAQLDAPAQLSETGAIRVNDAPITWIGDNQAKGISPDVPLITIHATPDFADKHWESPDAERAPLLIEAARPYLKSNVIDWQCHRWGYSFPINPWHDVFVEDADRNLFLAGDAFGGPRVEGAALSGLMAAAEFLDKRSRRPLRS